MARPRCRRRIEFEPEVTYFKPQGIPLRLLSEVCLPLEGLEALRLKDLEDLEGEAAARRMGVSRATFERVLAQARRAVSEALVGGKALRIQGGDYEVVARDPAPEPSPLCCGHRQPGTSGEGSGGKGGCRPICRDERSADEAPEQGSAAGSEKPPADDQPSAIQALGPGSPLTGSEERTPRRSR